MRKIGPYQLVSRLASGTLGDVFLAHTPSTSERRAVDRFAIKLIKPELANDPRISRLVLIESQTAINFSHPVHPRVHDADRDGADLYVASVLIGGQPLSSVLKKLRVENVPLDHRLVCHLGAEIASILGNAHELSWFTGAPAKFLHGMLAPKKIMLGYDGEAKLLGLGLGRARLTQPPGMGTLPWASPEIAQSKEPTPRADVYSLATVLYYAFTGRNIFRRSDEETTRAAIREANVPRLNSTTLTVDPAIGDLIAEMMAPRIDARPDSLVAIETKLREASSLTREVAQQQLSELVLTHFGEDAEAFRRQTKAAQRATPREPSFELVRRKVREESRLTESPKLPWTTHDIESDDGVDDAQITEPDRPRPTTGRIARYVIERPVSRSNTTTTYAGRDPNIARPLILKVLDPRSITDPRLPRTEWVRLFKIEARIAGRLRHEAFPILFDAGRDEGAYFIAFEYLGGETLANRLDRGESFRRERVKQIAIDLARALQEMHRVGLVHGDVKFSNVHLGDDGRARLIDLSLASYLEGPQHPLLGANLLVASPEFIEGGPYTALAEQFAFGMLLYQLLIGARPFRGIDDSALIASIRQQTPRPPEAIDPNVDPQLSEICMRTLEKDPRARFESMEHVVARLEGLPVSAIADTSRNAPVAELVDLRETVVRICERASSLSSPDALHPTTKAAAATARSVARRMGLDEDAQVRAAMAIAIRDLGDRARISIHSEEMRALIPTYVAELVDAVDRIGDEAEPDPLAQAVAVAEAYHRSTRTREGHLRSSPRRAVLDLRAEIGTRYQREIVEALVEHLREIVSALDLAPLDPTAPRILVAGVDSDALMHALEYDGFAIEEAADGHIAWEKLRQDSFSGAIVDASLPGRDAVSLLRLCRAHPDTAKIAFLILGNEAVASEVEGLEAASVLDKTAALENIRARVGELLRGR